MINSYVNSSNVASTLIFSLYINPLNVWVVSIILNLFYGFGCIFCSNKGIPLPHNHTIRDFSKKSNPIICPQLLNITCNYCKKKGHTKNYCHLLKQKNKIDKAIPISYKRLGFKNDMEINPTKMPKLGILTSAFGAMDME